jgi:transposase
MARAETQVKSDLTAAQLRRHYRRCRESTEARRWQAWWLLSQGRKAADVAQTLGMCSAWVRRVRQRYNAGGPESVQEGHRAHPGGRPPRLTEKQRQQLPRSLACPPQGGGLWTGAKVAKGIAARTKRKAHPQLGCAYLQRLGWSLQVPRRRHAQAASPAQQQAFKKSSGSRSPPFGGPCLRRPSKSGRMTKRGAA